MAVAEILSGVITPSGSASAEYVRDFTADPTWANTSTGRQFRFGAYGEDVPGDYVYRYPDENGKYLTIDPGSTGTVSAAWNTKRASTWATSTTRPSGTKSLRATPL